MVFSSLSKFIINLFSSFSLTSVFISLSEKFCSEPKLNWFARDFPLLIVLFKRSKLNKK